MSKAKDKEHAKTCAHCAFWEAHKLKYPDWERQKKKTGHYESKAFNNLMLKAMQVAAEALILLDANQRGEFIMSTVRLSEAMRGTDGGSDTAMALFEKLVSEAGWTKH